MSKTVRNRQKWVSILALLLALALASFVVAGCSGGGTESKEGASSEGTVSKQEQAQESRVSDEKNASVLYTYNCGPCHGGDGSGVVGPALKGTALSVEQIQAQIENGKTGSDGNVKMPGYKGGELTEAQIKAIASYVKNKLGQ